MLEYLKFSIGGFFGGYKTVKLWNKEDKSAYEVIRSGLMEDVEPGERHTIENHEWLAEWDNLRIGEWDKEYYDNDICDGTQWELDYREVGQTRRRIYGSNEYPPRWNRFIEWLDLLMPDMEFISPDELDCVVFSYQGSNNTEREQLLINRRERTVLLEKSHIQKADDDFPAIVKSTHCYDFGESEELLMDMLDKARRFFWEYSDDYVPPDGLQSDIDYSRQKQNDGTMFVTVKLTYHDGAKKNRIIGFTEARTDEWADLVNDIKSHISDVHSVILSIPPKNPTAADNKFLYCKVRFKDSYRTYSYRADDDTLKVGDVVDVPVGSDGNVIAATIAEIGYYSKADAPYPPERTKFIIGRHGEDA